LKAANFNAISIRFAFAGWLISNQGGSEYILEIYMLSQILYDKTEDVGKDV
jgi:hypothetical protein